MQDSPVRRLGVVVLGGVVGRGGCVVQLRPKDALVEAMLHGWRAQQTSRGLQESTMGQRERLVRAFVTFTNDYP
jgi:hypothetical protein